MPEFVAEVMENQWSRASLSPAAVELQDWNLMLWSEGLPQRLDDKQLTLAEKQTNISEGFN